MEILPRDYDFADGILFAHRLIYFIDGKRDATVHIERIEINPGLLAKTFALPTLVDAPPQEEGSP